MSLPAEEQKGTSIFSLKVIQRTDCSKIFVCGEAGENYCEDFISVHKHYDGFDALGCRSTIITMKTIFLSIFPLVL